MQPTPQTLVANGSATRDDHVESVYSKVSWRIMPLLVICYIVAFLDRINIGYAQLQMKQTLPFSDAVYGLGAGIFFIGYFIFEVPSNLMLEKIGARKTLLRIMFCWGHATAFEKHLDIVPVVERIADQARADCIGHLQIG